ncbi:MAG: DUF4261 domain-containing protein [Brevefilum sp.]|nr:DUF4261 domain-containing protein [Brevefilum sp.]
MTDQSQMTNQLLPTIHLIYGTPSFPTPDEEEVMEAIQTVLDSASDQGVQASWTIQQAEKCLGEIQFGLHRIQVAGMANPLPQEIVDCTIHTSPWQPQIKAAMRQHQSHLSFVYRDSAYDPVEKMIALYQTARAFAGEDLLGIVNENAWTAHPPADTLSSERIRSFRQDIPLNLWTGTVKFYVDQDNYWLVTKGHHIFDVPDLAYFVRGNEDAVEIINLFVNIFYYLFEQDVFVTAGDTLEITQQGQFLKFVEVPEGADFLMGPSGTLVIEKSAPDDIAKPG